MTDIRVLEVTAPAGNWNAVSLREASSPEGPWTAVQAAPVDGRRSISLAFRPTIPNGFYKTLWVAHGGSRNGIAEGPVMQLVGAVAAPVRGKVARIGGDA